MKHALLGALAISVALLTGCAHNCPVDTADSAGVPNTATFLMFQDGRAEEALRFYADTFPHASLGELEYHTQATGGPTGTLYRGFMVIDGQRIRAFDSPMKHDFEFTPSISFFVTLESAEECREVFETLAVGGQQMMPLGDYGFSELFGWVQDRYGVSWQLMYRERDGADTAM